MTEPRTARDKTLETLALRICPTCCRPCQAVAEASYFIGLQESWPFWLCPSCFDRLDVEVVGLELTGRFRDDARPFGRKNR